MTRKRTGPKKRVLRIVGLAVCLIGCLAGGGELLAWATSKPTVYAGDTSTKPSEHTENVKPSANEAASDNVKTSENPLEKPTSDTSSVACATISGTNADILGNKPVASKQKVVALTFDDGPDSRWTPQVLDILKRYHVKATFFTVGKQVKRFPNVAKRIVEEGHMIGNHTWDHPQLTKLDDQHIIQEISETDQTIEHATGVDPTFVRAPYGAVSPVVKEIVTSDKKQLVGWNVDTRDWAGSPPSKILENIKQHTVPGSTILMHSFGGRHGNLSNTIQALPQIIEYLHKQGYTFVTVGELSAM